MEIFQEAKTFNIVNNMEIFQYYNKQRIQQ